MTCYRETDYNTGNSMPYSLRIVYGLFYIEGLRDGAYGLSSLCETTRESVHLQMSLQRQHFLLSYLKTRRVGPAEVLNPFLASVAHNEFRPHRFAQNERKLKCTRKGVCSERKLCNVLTCPETMLKRTSY